MNDLLQSMALAGAGQWSGSTDHLEAPEDPGSASGSQRMKELAYSTTAIDYTTLSSRHKLKNKGRGADPRTSSGVVLPRVCCVVCVCSGASLYLEVMEQ